MKKLLILVLTGIVAVACNQKKPDNATVEPTEVEVSDSTIYGICGSGTMMHTLELITNMDDTLTIFINDEDADQMTEVAGGLMCGDRMAVTAYKTDDGLTASRVINITSLIGKWSSIDKKFEITEDGDVQSEVKAESNTWTSWRILNGQLLLNRDTFDIITLGADSLELENHDGIYYYKRLHDALPEEAL